MRQFPFMALALCALAGTAIADTDRSGYAAEAANHASYVRSVAVGAQRAQMYLDNVYAADLKALKRTNSVDLQMAQCFGGGFLNDIAGELNAATFASASAWNEVAISRERRNAAGTLTQVDNFTRASVEARARSVANPMRPNFRVTRNGLPNLPPVPLNPDPTAIVGADPTEGRAHLQYWSPDPVQAPGVATPNDDRTLFHAPAFADPNGAKQYAVLISWSKEDPRHEFNIARQVEILRNVYRVPADNIVVLVGDRAGGTIAANPSLTLNGMPGGTPAVSIDAGNRIENFRNAIRGDLFKVNGVANSALANPANRNLPGAADKLFVYNTGHGGHGTWNNALQPDGTNRRQFVPTQGGVNFTAKAAVIADMEVAPSLVGSDGLVKVQVTTSAPLDPTIFLEINGVNPLGNFTPLATSLVLDESRILDVTPLLELAGMTIVSPLFSYEVSVPWQQVDNASGTGIDLNFGGVFSQSASDSLLSMTFASGDQEYTHVFIPTPGSLGVCMGGVLLLSVRRRRSR